MKQKVCIAGVVLGVIMLILGIVVLSGSGRDADALLSFSGEEPRDTSFGGDFYTYSYKASRAAANNLADLGELVEDAIGVLLMAFGAGTVLLSLYGYAGCRESGAPARPAAPIPAPRAAEKSADEAIWTCPACGVSQPRYAPSCSRCGRPNPDVAPAPVPASPSPVASVASRMKNLLKSVGEAAPEWVTQKNRPAHSPERRPVSGNTWICNCGASNHVSKGSCDACGAAKPSRERRAAQAAPAPAAKKPASAPGSWTCTCGAQWPAHRGTCENCGERKPK